jgi:hypothetical protein
VLLLPVPKPLRRVPLLLVINLVVVRVAQQKEVGEGVAHRGGNVGAVARALHAVNVGHLCVLAVDAGPNLEYDRHYAPRCVASAAAQGPERSLGCGMDLLALACALS